MNEDEIGSIVIGCALKVHRNLGPGLLESCYEVCLMHELLKAGLKVDRQKTMPILYDGLEIDSGFRLDLLVENKVVVELKTVKDILDVHVAQILTYLKLGNFKLGYILNFNEKLLKDGIKRVIID